MTNRTTPRSESASVDKALDWLDEMQGHPPAAVGRRSPLADLPTWLREDMGFVTSPLASGAALTAEDNLSWLDGIASGRGSALDESPTMSWDETGNYAAPTAPHADAQSAVVPDGVIDAALPDDGWPQPDADVWPDLPAADPLWDPSAPLLPFDNLLDERSAPTRVGAPADAETNEAASPLDDAETIEAPVAAPASAETPPADPPLVVVALDEAATDEATLDEAPPDDVLPFDGAPSDGGALAEVSPDAPVLPEDFVDQASAAADQPDAAGAVDALSELIVLQPDGSEPTAAAEPGVARLDAEGAIPLDLAAEIPEDPDEAIAWLETLAKRQSDAVRQRGAPPTLQPRGLDAARIDAMLAAAEPDDWGSDNATPTPAEPTSDAASAIDPSAAVLAADALIDDPEMRVPTVVLPSPELPPAPDVAPPPTPEVEEGDHPTVTTTALPADLGDADDHRPTITLTEPGLVEAALADDGDAEAFDLPRPVADAPEAASADLPLDLLNLPPDYLGDEPTRPADSVTAGDLIDLTPPSAPQEINEALAWLEELVGRLDGAPIDETTVELENMDVSALLGAEPPLPELPPMSTAERKDALTMAPTDGAPTADPGISEETTQPIPALAQPPAAPPLPAEPDDLEAALEWLQSAEDEGSSVIETAEPDTPSTGSRLATTITELFAAERRRAQGALAAGDYDLFAAEYRTLIDQSPTAAVVAESDLRALSHELPPLPQVTRLLGDACAAQGAFEQAVEHYREALDQSRADASRDVVSDVEAVLPWLDLLQEEASAPAETLGRLRDALPALLQRLNVARIPTVGERYDPLLHEVVEEEPPGDRPSGLVTAERRPGYRRGNRVMRSAQVVITA